MVNSASKQTNPVLNPCEGALCVFLKKKKRGHFCFSLPFPCPTRSPFVHFPNFLLFSSTGYCQQPLHKHHHHHLSRSILNISNAFVIMANIILIGFTKIDHNNGFIKELWRLTGEALWISLRFFMNKFWRCFLRVFGLKRLD